MIKNGYSIKNYLEGNDEYLKSLDYSFSDAEMHSDYYLFDFNKHKVLKIKGIFVDSTGKLIQ